MLRMGEPLRTGVFGEAARVAERVRTIVAPIARALALDLVDVECAGQGGRTVVRVFIDKPGGVTLQDCEQVHQSLGRALDVEDPIPHAYTLEVSSPGLDRPLKRREDYQRAVGKLVNLKLRQPWNGQWRVVASLLAVGDGGVTMAGLAQDPEQTTLVPWDMIGEARLEAEW
ncbi:MAG: ribosome maturation factor RimP [Nitrospirota bacterium]